MTTEHYVHIIAAPGLVQIAPPPANAEPDNAGEGLCLFMSTSTHRIHDYILLHSIEEYGLGLALSSWRYRGTLSSNGYPIGSRTIFDMAGPIHTEGFLCKNDDGYVEFYVRLSVSVPRCRFALYHLNVREPELWWSATLWDYEKQVLRPDLVSLVESPQSGVLTIPQRPGT